MDLLPEQQGRDRRRRRRARVSQSSQIANRISEILLVLVVVGSVLAIGTVHIQILLAISAMALVGGALGALSLERLPLPSLVLAAFALVSALQAVPLPAALVERLSPITAHTWLRALSPLHESGPARFSLSLDTGASVAEALKWLTYAAVYVMAARVRARRGSGWLAALVFGSATLVSVITLLHGAADVQTLYGVYRPNFAVHRWNVGPLLNTNNFAGYANLGLFAGLGILLGHKARMPRLPALAAIVTIVGALLVSTSRAGIISGFAGGGLVLLWLSRDRNARVLRRAVPPLAVLSVSLMVLLAYVASRNWPKWEPTDVERKLAVWRWSVDMIRDHAWFGVGRGAFETALPAYRTPLLNEDWTAVHSHAENFAVQWIAEWGIPVGVLAIVVLVGYVLLQWHAARNERLRFLLLTGLAVLLLQNLADLGLEIPSVAIAAIVALAAGERAAGRASSTALDSRPRPQMAIVVAVPMFAIWVAALVWSRSPVEVERRTASRAYHEVDLKDAAERIGFRAQLRDAMLRHPGEAHFPLLGAVVAYRARDEAPLPWIARALEVAPTNGRVHLVLAELFGAHHLANQAMLHLRYAALYDSTLVNLAASRAAQWAPSLDVLLQAIPTGKPGELMLETACSQLAKTEMKVMCFRRASADYPKNTVLESRLADALLQAINTRDVPCAGVSASACAIEADHAAREIARLEPDSWRPGYIIAKLLLAKGDAKAAAALLARVCPADSKGQECARQAVSAAIMAGGDDDEILVATEKYAARACSTGATCASTLDWIGGTLDTGGKPALALSYYTKAAEADGTAARWLRVGDRAGKARLFGLARTAIQRAGHSPDSNAGSRAYAESLMNRIAPGLAAAGQ